MLRRDVISGTSASGDAYALFLKHGQIEFVRLICPAACKLLKMSNL
jgi:hypothetical protein